MCFSEAVTIYLAVPDNDIRGDTASPSKVDPPDEVAFRRRKQSETPQWPPHESEQSKLDNNVLLSKNKIYRDLRGGRKVRRPRSADARIVADLARADKNLSSRSRSQNNQLVDQI